MLSDALMLCTTLALSEGLRVAIQVVASLALVAAVLLFMWKLPVSGERFFGWAPPLALLSAWCGLAAVILSILLWRLPSPDWWISTTLLILDPASLCFGVLVLWIYRKHDGDEETVHMQLIQARTGILLGLIAVALGYWFVMTHKAPFTPVGS